MTHSIYQVRDTHMPCMIQGQGSPLVLLHGALANHDLWQEHATVLSRHHTLVMPTLRHFGAAGQEGPFGLETHAADLLALLARLNLGPVHLAGWSYGADVALTAALAEPSSFHSLCLIEPGCPGSLDEADMAAFMADAGAMFGPLFELVAAGRLEEGVAALIDGSSGRPGYFDAQPLHWQRAQLNEAYSLPKQLAQQERPDLSAARLAGLVLPTCILQGARTRPLFALVCEAIAQALPDVRLEMIADACHLYPLEQPSALARRLLDWLQRIPT